MRRPRVRLREFLLLITLASLITASFSIRARTAHRVFRDEQAFRLHRARSSVKAWEGQIGHVKRQLELFPPISEDWASRYDLRLMPAVKEVTDIPTEGKNLIIVADIYGMLEVRMFDGDGKVVVNIAENQNIEAFKEELEGLWSPHELTGDEKRWIIGTVTTIVGNGRVRMQKYLQSMQASHAKAVGEAEEREWLAERP